jgi:signal transduction histidine kinase
MSAVDRRVTVGAQTAMTGDVHAALKPLPRWVWDVALPASLFAGGLLEGWQGVPARAPGGTALALTVLAGITTPLVLRRRAPVVVMLVSSAIAIASGVVGIPGTTTEAVAVAAAMYAVFVQRGVRVGSAAAVLAWFVAAVHINPFVVGPAPIIYNTEFLAVVAAAGLVVREQRRTANSLADATALLEDERHRATRAAVAQERNTIARELLALVVGGLRSMVQQAGAALAAIRDGLTDVDPLLDRVETSGRQTLVEMRRVLSLLRSDDEARAPLAPSEVRDGDAATSDSSPPGQPDVVVPAADRWRLRIAAVPHWAIDASLITALALGVVVEWWQRSVPVFGADHDARSLALGLVAVAALLVRRVLPELSLAICLAAVVAEGLLDVASTTTALTTVMVALYSLSVRRGAAAAVAGGALTSAAFAWAEGLAFGIGPVSVIVILSVIAGYMGHAVREQKRLNAELSGQNEELATQHAIVLQLAVHRERLRLARDMHDVVAHSASAMVVQAAAARRVLRTQPAEALQALEAITEAGAVALKELTSGIGVSPDGPATSALEFGNLDTLVRQAHREGLPVTAETQGDLTTLDPTVQLTLYRILQEALTNVRKHAGQVPTTVRLQRGEDAVELEVRNAPPLRTPSQLLPGARLGLVGMRERAAMFSGDCEARPVPDGGFDVRVRLRLRPATP